MKHDEPEREVCPVCDSRMAITWSKKWSCVCGSEGIILNGRLVALSAPAYFEHFREPEARSPENREWRLEIEREKKKIARQRRKGLLK